MQHRLGAPPSTLSFHLSALEQAGLIRATMSGRMMIYAVSVIGLQRLLAYVTETCSHGQPDHRGGGIAEDRQDVVPRLLRRVGTG